MSRSARVVVLLCLVALAGRAAAAGEPQWVRVSTSNFVVYSDAGAARARAIAERLESFRALLASLFPRQVRAGHDDQVPVVAFRSEASFRPFKPLYNGKPANVAGLFLGGNEQPLMALDVSAWEGSSHVVFHEYIHRLMAANETPVPVWFNEGVAEFYSTATTQGAKAQVGKVVPGHMVRLVERGLLPFESFLSVKRDSPEYNERDRQGIFYAQAWAFVHYCVLDPEQKRQQQLVNLATRQGRGEPPAAAFRAAFGMEPAAMGKLLGDYVRQATVPIMNVTFPAPIEVQRAVAEPAPPVEVEYFLGNILALTNRLDDAEPRFRRATELDAASSLPYEGLGFVALRRNDRAAARAAFAEARKRNSKSHLALYYFAAASMGTLDDTTRPAVRAALERAVSIRPDFAGSYELLTSVVLESGDTAGAVSWAERGLKVDPQNGRIRLNLAIAQAREGREADARENLLRVVDTSDDEGVRDYARSMLGRLGAEADRPAAPEPTTVVEVTTTDAERPGEAPSEEVHIRVAEGEVRGVVTRVDCERRTLTVHVTVGGKPMVFSTTDTSTMIVGMLGEERIKFERIECGKALEREAYIQFDPSAPGATTGTLKAIMFLQPPKR